MTGRAWLESLAVEGWRFWSEEGRLRYRAPRSGAGPEVLARLKEAREEILALLAAEPDALDLAPLSWGQRALWFLWKLAPSSTAYHQSMPLELGAGARAHDWRAAAGDVVSRHAMLRTRIRERAGEPVQRISMRAIVPWEETDARGWDAGRLSAAMRASHERPFALDEAPPVRFHWFARGEGAVLLVSMHHVACDAWSLELLRRDLAEAAAARAAGGAWTAPPPAHTYPDFVLWQRALLASEAGERLWGFWRDTLAEPRARLDLPLDSARPLVQAYDGGSVSVAIPEDLAKAVRAFARSRNITLYTALLAGFLAFLHRLARQDDLVIGTPTAGRSQPEFADVVGYFVEPVALRVAVAPGASFEDLLDRTRETVSGAMAHADFPFPLVVERLRVERDPGRSPIFDVTFNYLNRRAQAAGEADGAPRPPSLDLPQADGKFDLTLTVVDDEEVMRAALGFNTALFARQTVEGFGAALVAILRAAVDAPSRPLAALPLGHAVTAPAIAGRATDLAALVPVHHQVAEVAARHPERTAVVAADGALTYRTLVDRADELAAELVALGVGADVTVGLRVPRSTDFVVGLLGILRAGGAYVPIDPDQPDALGERMLDGARAVAVVGPGCVVTPRGAPSSAPAPGRPPLDRLAYVIFTSGSTGEPKGVAIEHRALANYVASIVADLTIEPGRSHAFVSTIAADLGHTVIFPALVTGGTLHVFSQAQVTERDAFARAMAGAAIDYLKIVPSHLAALVDEHDPVLPRRALFLGGEGASTAWALRLASRTGCRVCNHYGPTETTVGVLTAVLEPAHPPATTTLALDLAVANTAIWILDEARRPVPPGVPGEVWVSGAALARGYLGDEARTAERFVELAGVGRAYRTGDIARTLPGGGLVLMGRGDRQVKLRGYRVELGQVESVLAVPASVRQAIVLPDAEDGTATGLVAWVVADDPAVTPGSLRAAAEAALPHYMVPYRISIVDRVPLTTNGKVDTRRLRADLAGRDAGAPASAARDVLEMRVARIWAEALGRPRVGVHDDFFALGGHSLLAVQVASRIHEEFGKRLPLSAFFTARTVAALSDLMRVPGDDGERLVCLQPHGDQPPLICFPGAGGGLLYFQYLVAALQPNVPVWGAQAPVVAAAGRDVPALAVTFADAIVAEPRLSPPYRLVGHSFGALVAYETASVLRARGLAVAAVVVLDNPAPGGSGSDGQAGWDDARWARHIAARVERLYGVDLGTEAAADAAGGPDWLLDRLMGARLLPIGTSRDYFRQYVEGYKVNVRAAETYWPAAVPGEVPLVVVRAAERDAAIDIAAGLDADLGWGRFGPRPPVAIEAPGTHISMLTEPHVRVLARALRDSLGIRDSSPGGDGRPSAGANE